MLLDSPTLSLPNPVHIVPQTGDDVLSAGEGYRSGPCRIGALHDDGTSLLNAHEEQPRAAEKTYKGAP